MGDSQATFLTAEFIATVRDGKSPASRDIDSFIAGVTDGSISDAQIAAFAMAVYCRDLDVPSRVALTCAMRDSGAVLDWPGLAGPLLDKHSTGGIGDNVSLVLGPVVAACGGYVPMISGRGLGHTGGTLDKLDAIAGYNSLPGLELLRRTVRRAGVAIIGQTGELAPADGRIYAVRSATASVENISLITASILSKKLAEGLDALVLDVKCGNGAFMTDIEAARALAQSLVSVANGAGVKTTALISDMNEPLAPAAGNGLEVANAVGMLKGDRAGSRLYQLVVALSAQMLVAGGLAPDEVSGARQARQVLANGTAAEKFGQMVAMLGGPANFVEQPERYLDKAPIIFDVKSPRDGVVCAIDTRKIGLAVIVLGGGRRNVHDAIDHATGFDRLAGLGQKVSKGDVLARLHARSNDAGETAAAMLREAYDIGQAGESAGVVMEQVAAKAGR